MRYKKKRKTRIMYQNVKVQKSRNTSENNRTLRKKRQIQWSNSLKNKKNTFKPSFKLPYSEDHFLKKVDVEENYFFIHLTLFDGTKRPSSTFL